MGSIPVAGATTRDCRCSPFCRGTRNTQTHLCDLSQNWVRIFAEERHPLARGRRGEKSSPEAKFPLNIYKGTAVAVPFVVAPATLKPISATCRRIGFAFSPKSDIRLREVGEAKNLRQRRNSR